MNFTALVAGCDGDGVVGFARGRGRTSAWRWRRRPQGDQEPGVHRAVQTTIFHAQEAKHCKTKIRLMPARAGTG